MAYEIHFKSSVYKDLKTIPKKHASNILDLIESEIGTCPKKYPVLQANFKGLRKFRHGDYRVIFAIIDNAVLVTRIRHRKDVYHK